ncbi:MAG: ATP-dependent RNA helicase [Deltaproteobacteria bacterium]|nr:MAG: ATP-dependent RNA helicase [Deltaproteobacteria bacterium]
MKLSLPIDSLLPQITEHLTEKSNLILQASPGSGKTTRVPPALLKMIPEGKEIWVLVPRRLAAKAAARRMAEELGENVGETVGYQFRFETVTSAKTQIRLMTEGLFPKLLRQDPQLKKVGAVILDEFHERHLHTDTALGLLKNIQNKNRPDLKIIVMSATIETEKLAQYLSSSVITLESPIYPLEISYLPHIPQGRLDDLVFQTLQTIQKKNLAGDVLVFLPGFADIRRCEKKLIGQFQNTKILSLYGDLSKEEQDLVFQKISERKIILSTNIAESSLTIPGVSIVIDSGWHRQASFSHWSGIPSLKTRPISQASAIQRAGRAARMGPGVCFRLYTRSDFEGRTPFEKPEILRADLSQMILELKSLHNFPLDWFENPPAQHVQTSLNLLCQLGAVDSDLLTSSLTKEGSEMADLPLHPRLSRMLLEAKKRECLSEAIQLAALMSEGDFQSLDVMEELKRDDWDFETKKLIQSLTTTLIASPTKKFLSENLAQSLLSAFSDRVAQKESALSGG